MSISSDLGDAGFRILFHVGWSAVVNLISPTYLAFQVSRVLVTLANFIVFVLLLVMFFVGGLVRLPGARKGIAAVRREQLRSEDAES